jgi:hypothetical protein
VRLQDLARWYTPEDKRFLEQPPEAIRITLYLTGDGAKPRASYMDYLAEYPIQPESSLIAASTNFVCRNDAPVCSHSRLTGLEPEGNRGDLQRRLSAALCESVGGGGGMNRTTLGPKKVTHTHLVVKKTNPRGWKQTLATGEAGEGWSYRLSKYVAYITAVDGHRVFTYNLVIYVFITMYV